VAVDALVEPMGEHLERDARKTRPLAL
jgi:hypothetical protein